MTNYTTEFLIAFLHLLDTMSAEEITEVEKRIAIIKTLKPEKFKTDLEHTSI